MGKSYPRAVEFLGVEIPISSWRDGLRKIVVEMASRHPVYYRALMLSLPRYHGATAASKSRMVVDKHAGHPYPEEYSIEIPHDLLMHSRGYSVEDIRLAAQRVVFAFGYDPKSVQWIG